MKTLITGHGRSATGYMAKLMQAAGLDIGHEILGKDGVSSWLHIAPGGSVTWAGEIEAVNYDHIIHVVRNPLDVIASAQTLRDESWLYMERVIGRRLPTDKVERAMTTYLEWNRLIDQHGPSLRVRAEDIRKEWPEIMKTIGHVARFPKEGETKGFNSRRHGVLSWADLKKKNPALCSKIKKMAGRYGYETEDKAVTVSVCMIVKDEEKNLPRCLDSVAEIADEIIVVDTGSTDRTVEIAKSYGAKIISSPWRDDFSFHRNESIEKATCDWILRIDADEELVIDGGAAAFKAQLAKVPKQCEMTRNMMQDMQGGQVALTFQQHHFFRRGNVRYVNRKHNRPIFDGPIWQIKGVKTLHYGYDKDQIAGKKERDLELLLKMHEEDPDNAQVLFYLAQTYGHYFQDAKKALEYCEQYIEVAQDSPEFNTSAFTSCSEIAKCAGESEKAVQYVDMGLEKYPHDIDLNFLKTKWSATANDGAAVEKHAQRYLEAFDEMNMHPEKNDGRFTWFFNMDSLIFVMHKACIAHLFKGIQYLEKFKEFVPQASEKIGADVQRCMEIDLDKIGVGLT